MKRLLIIAGLLLTLCNVAVGVAYARCKCYESGGAWCEGNFCYADPMGRCHCYEEEPEGWPEPDIET